MLIKYAIVTVGAFVLNLVLIGIFRRLALKNKFLLSHGVPSIGGIAIGMSFITASLAGFLTGGALTHASLGILVASSIMLVFGVLDDHFELSVRAKFFLQILAVGALIFLGVRTQIMRIGDAANVAITTLWVLGITNAYNHLDVMDGLAGGAAAIAAGAFVCLAVASRDTHVIIMGLALLGALASFLIFNLPPAKVYMGNSGSHLVGFILAALAPLISYAPMEHKLALATPILILGLPVFDTVFLMVMRAGKGRSVFLKSNDHMALRFLKKGYSKTRALYVMLALGIYFALSGIFLMEASARTAVVAVAAAGVVGLCFMTDMGRVFIDG